MSRLEAFDAECSSLSVSDSSHKNRKRFLTRVINVRPMFRLMLSVQNALLYLFVCVKDISVLIATTNEQ